MEAKDVKFKILPVINNSETQLIEKFLYVTVCAYIFKKYTVLVLKKIVFL